MKKVLGGILIWDVLFVTAAIFTSVIDVFLGIEMADAGTHRIKIAHLCRFCGKTASSKHVCKTERKIQAWIRTTWCQCWRRQRFYSSPQCSPDVFGAGTIFIRRLRRSIARGKLPKILESKNQFQQLAVLIYFPEMPSKLGQFSGTLVDISSSEW